MVPVVIGGPSGECECEVDASPAATVGDLLAALDSSGPMAVDGRLAPSESPISSVLVAGAVLTTGTVPAAVGPGDTSPIDATGFRFQVLAGPGAGMAVDLAPGRHLVGSGDRATVRLRAGGVASRHCRIEVTGGAALLICGAGAVALDDDTVLIIGEALVAVASAPEATPAATAAKHQPFNRRPRTPPSGRDEPLTVPEQAVAATASRPVGWIALAAPVAFGLAMALLVDPRMALFALLGPVVMVGGRIDEQRSRRRARRQADTRITADIATLVSGLSERRAGELRRHRTDHPPVAMLAWWVERRAPRLWERRRHDPDFLRLAIGYGAIPWKPPVTGGRRAADAVVAVVAGAARIELAPVTLDLLPGSVLGVTGERATALDLARGLVCAAAALHGPSDLRVAVFTDRPDAWSWASWLPHSQVAAGDRRRLLSADPGDTTAVLTTIAEGLGTEDDRPVVLAVVDRGGGLADPDGLAIRRMLAAGATVGVSGIVCAPTRDELPVECTSVVECRHHRAALDSGTEMLVAGAVEPVACAVARGLARYRDPDLVDPGAGLPDRVRMLDLLGITDLTPRGPADPVGRGR